jgi:hypothetical protein
MTRPLMSPDGSRIRGTLERLASVAQCGDITRNPDGTLEFSWSRRLRRRTKMLGPEPHPLVTLMQELWDDYGLDHEGDLIIPGRESDPDMVAKLAALIDREAPSKPWSCSNCGNTDQDGSDQCVDCGQSNEEDDDGA